VIRWAAGSWSHEGHRARTRGRWMRCIATRTGCWSASSRETRTRSWPCIACTSPRSSAGCCAAPATRRSPRTLPPRRSAPRCLPLRATGRPSARSPSRATSPVSRSRSERSAGPTR
jgi:hypothetical protein